MLSFFKLISEKTWRSVQNNNQKSLEDMKIYLIVFCQHSIYRLYNFTCNSWAFRGHLILHLKYWFCLIVSFLKFFFL